MIGVWAPYRRTGRTAITAALACKISEQLPKDKKILVCCANGSNGKLLKSMDISSDEASLEDLVSYRLGGFSGGDYGLLLAIKGRVSFAGSSKMTPLFVKSNIDVYQKVFKDLKNYFDIILLDLPEGREDVLGNVLMESCNKIVTVIEQDMDMLNTKDYLVDSDKENIIIINKFKNIYPQKADIKNILTLKEHIFFTPECDLLREMRNRQKLLEYLTMDTDFNNEIRNIVAKVLISTSTSEMLENTAATHVRKLFGRFRINELGGQQG